ncbi:MAG: accessory factor UbiK family protein [Candidatus Accumulibacter sp.]|jgi:BMFP domain-containing protein YqiC|nr:accessory factor UbiK family protein [Accumulibacter sp.]
MMDPKVFEELGAKFGAFVASTPAADIEKNARVLLSGAFAKLDLIGREEFELQARLLRQAGEKIEALEKRVASLESQRSD